MTDQKAKSDLIWTKNGAEVYLSWLIMNLN